MRRSSTDRLSQYAANRCVELLQGHAAQAGMAEVGASTQNGYAERLTLAPHASAGVGTIKEEEVDLSDYEDYHHACRQIGQFLKDVF